MAFVDKPSDVPGHVEQAIWSVLVACFQASYTADWPAFSAVTDSFVDR